MYVPAAPCGPQSAMLRIKTIARELKMSEPTVKRALRDLDAGFLLKVTRRRQNGGQSSNLYILKSVEKSVTHVENAKAGDKGVASAQTNAATAAAPQDDMGGAADLDCEEGAGNAPLAPACPSDSDIISGQPSRHLTARVAAAFSSIPNALLRTFSFFSVRFLPVHTAFLVFVAPSPGYEFTPQRELTS